MLSRNHKARLKIDRQRRGERGEQRGRQSVRQLDRLQLLCNLRCVCFVSVSVAVFCFCFAFLLPFFMAFTFSFSRVASLLSFLCRLGSNLLTTTSHCCGFEAHNNCTHCAFCFAHSVCVFTREAEGGYMARTCLMAQSNLSANKSHKN